MKLAEHQAKAILAPYGVPVPEGEVCADPDAAAEAARRLGGKVAVKAQVLTGGRGKAGGIRLAQGPDEARQAATAILGSDIRGFSVAKVLVEEAAEIAQELYLGAVLDRAGARVVMMASAEGGVEIEALAESSPEGIVRVPVHPLLGLQDHQARRLGFGIGLEGERLSEFVQIATALYRAMEDKAATLAEINPLVVTEGGALLALDAKMVVDDNALGRLPDIEALREEHPDDPREAEARRNGLSYVRMDGQIGCMVNGAGLAMATMDVIKLHGAEPANFLDIGGGAQEDRVAAAFRILVSDDSVRAVLVNIFGGITRGDEVARGILKALEEVELRVPMVVRLVGTRAEEGMKLLSEAEIVTADSLEEAARMAVSLAAEPQKVVS
ncbi:MAG: ADP-forming succinate--CoA ligase subunit beta [Anaerolineae bacterium]